MKSLDTAEFLEKEEELCRDWAAPSRLSKQRKMVAALDSTAKPSDALENASLYRFTQNSYLQVILPAVSRMQKPAAPSQPVPSLTRMLGFEYVSLTRLCLSGLHDLFQGKAAPDHQRRSLSLHQLLLLELRE